MFKRHIANTGNEESHLADFMLDAETFRFDKTSGIGIEKGSIRIY